MRRGLILWVSFFFLVTLSAQLPERIYWHHLGTEDGLRSGANDHFYKDSRGYLWIGSQYGLQRYDGTPFPTTFGTRPVDSTGIQGQNIQGEILEDKEGNIWVTTFQALNQYDYKSSTFTPYFFQDSTDNRAGGFINCGYSKREMWLLYKGRIVLFDLERKIFKEVYDICREELNKGVIHQSGNLTYFYSFVSGKEDFTACIFRGHELISDTTILTPGRPINKILPIDTARILIGGEDDSGLLDYDCRTNTSIIHSNNKLEGGISCFSQLSEDAILFGTSAGNIYSFNLSNYQISNVDFPVQRENDPDDGIYKIYTNPDGTIFVSRKKTGLYHTNKNKGKFSRKLEGRVVVGMAQIESGNILVFTNQGIVVLDEQGNFLKEHPTKDMNKSHINTSYFLKSKNGRLYTSYFWKIKTYEPNKDRFEWIGNADNLNYIILLEDDRALVSNYTKEGLYMLDPERKTVENEPISGFEDISPVTFAYQTNKGDLVLAEGLTKLCFYDPVTFVKKRSIPYSGEITSMYEFPNDSLLWIGSAIGLTTFNYNTGEIKHVKGHPAIPGNDVYGVLPGSADDLWLSTNQGLCRMNSVTKAVTRYTKADGLPTMEFMRNSHLKLRDGRLAFGTMNGLIIFDPQSIKSNIPLAKPIITQIVVNGEVAEDLKCTKTKSTSYNEMKSLELGPDENRLEFHFASLEFSYPITNKVRYRLLPGEKKWSEEANGGKCQYANLSPNNYSLEVQAANSDGIWNSESKILKFTILPRWYQRGPYIIFMLIVAAIIVAVITVWIQKRKQKFLQLEYEKDIALEKQRVLISRNMHDDLGSALSAIKLKTTVLSIKSKDPEHKLELKRLGSRIKSIDQKIQEAIWAVDARNDSVEKLIEYLINHIRDLFDDNPIQYELLLPTELPDYLVSGDIRRMVVLAYKEILNNIIKHAQATKIWVDILLFHEQTMQIIIRDNGKGFDVAEKQLGDGNGLDNMRFRMEKIGGTCRFLPVEKGTSVELTFNLRQN